MNVHNFRLRILSLSVCLISAVFFAVVAQAAPASGAVRVQGLTFSSAEGPLKLAGFGAPTLLAKDGGDVAGFVKEAKVAGANVLYADASLAQAGKDQSDEAVLKRLDALVAAAKSNGLKVLLALASDPLRVSYATWAGSPNSGVFYYDFNCRKWHKAFLQKLLKRVNGTAGGSAVLGWVLVDPALNPGGNSSDVERYITETAGLVKSLAPNQLAAVAVEGGDAGGVEPSVLAALPGVDFILYRGPSKDAEAVAQKSGKPAVVLTAAAGAAAPGGNAGGLLVDWKDPAKSPDEPGVRKLLAAVVSASSGPSGLFKSISAAMGKTPILKLDGTAVVKVTLAKPVGVAVRYGLGGMLDQEKASKGSDASHSIRLSDLRAGGEYSYQVLAVDAKGVTAFSERKAFQVPDAVRIRAVARPYSGNFIRAKDSRFWDGAKPYRYVGANNYYLHLSDDKKIDSVFADCVSIGFTVMRTWAFGCTDKTQESWAGEMDRYFTLGPDKYREKSFQDLDRVVASAKRHKVRVILALANNWTDYGGAEVWAQYFGYKDKNDFFDKEEVKKAFKAYMKKLATRVNTITGVAYKDDPIIFAWDLMNEPRFERDPSGKTLAAWVDEMAKELKGYGVKQMVTTGSEGFVATDGRHYGGSDFTTVHASPAIDFATYHIYPASEWSKWNLPTTQAIIRERIELAKTKIKKPVVMEEFGIGYNIPNYDRPVFVAGMVDAFLKAGGDGLNYWMLIDPDYAWGDGNDFSIKDVDMCNIFTLAANELIKQ